MAIVDDKQDTTPPILVVLYDDAIEPDATVAPAGEVRFTVMNRGARAHDFAIELIAASADTRLTPEQREPMTRRIEAIAPGDSADVVVSLDSGRYVLANTGAGASGGLDEARAELTVQPAATYDDHEGRAAGRRE